MEHYENYYHTFDKKLEMMGFKDLKAGHLFIKMMEENNISFQFLKHEDVQVIETEKGLNILVDTPRMSNLELAIINEQDIEKSAIGRYIDWMQNDGSDSVRECDILSLDNTAYRDVLREVTFGEGYTGLQKFNIEVQNYMAVMGSDEQEAEDKLFEHIEQGDFGRLPDDILERTIAEEMACDYQSKAAVMEHSVENVDHEKDNDMIIYIVNGSDMYNHSRFFEYDVEDFMEKHGFEYESDLERLVEYATKNGYDLALCSDEKISVLNDLAIADDYKELFSDAEMARKYNYLSKADQQIRDAFAVFCDKNGAIKDSFETINCKIAQGIGTFDVTTKDNKHVVIEVDFKRTAQSQGAVVIKEGNFKDLCRGEQQIFESNLKQVKDNPLVYADLTNTARSNAYISERAIAAEPTNFYYIDSSLNNREFVNRMIEERPDVYKVLDGQWKVDPYVARYALQQDGMLLGDMPKQLINKYPQLSFEAVKQNPQAIKFVPEQYKNAKEIRDVITSQPQQKITSFADTLQAAKAEQAKRAQNKTQTQPNKEER